MVTAMCLGLGMFSLLIWFRWKDSTAHLFFSMAAFGAGLFAITDLVSFHAQSIESLIICLKWANAGVYMILIGMVWFIHFYFGTARLWLAMMITSIWSILLVIKEPFSVIIGTVRSTAIPVVTQDRGSPIK